MMSAKCLGYMDAIGKTLEDNGIDRMQFVAAVRFLTDILDRIDEHHIPPQTNG